MSLKYFDKFFFLLLHSIHSFQLILELKHPLWGSGWEKLKPLECQLIVYRSEFSVLSTGEPFVCGAQLSLCKSSQQRKKKLNIEANYRTDNLTRWSVKNGKVWGKWIELAIFYWMKSNIHGTRRGFWSGLEGGAGVGLIGWISETLSFV